MAFDACIKVPLILEEMVKWQAPIRVRKPFTHSQIKV